MKVSAFRVVLALGGAGMLGLGALPSSAAAQLAAQQSAERLLVLPFAAQPADSAASIALGDALRNRLAQTARRWVQVVPKDKLCEALRASGFPCDGLLDDQQASQLARFLQVNAYITGTFQRTDSVLEAQVRSLDISSSGLAASFTVRDSNPATPLALAEKIAQRLTPTIRASEAVQECIAERTRGQYNRARAAAQRALTVDPSSAGAHLCIATIYEAQRMPLDSQIAASRRALVGDPLNATAWENIARAYQQRGDTAAMIDAFVEQLKGQPRNTSKRLAVAQLLRQLKEYERAVAVLDEGLELSPGENQMLDLKAVICVEGSMHQCTVEVFLQKAAADTALLRDSTFLKPAIGAAQQAADTQALLTFTKAAVQHFPNDDAFRKALASAYELAGQTDSALAIYRDVLRRDPNDVATSLLIAKTIVDGAAYDTVKARQLREARDSVGLQALQNAFAMKVDSARPFLRPGLSSPDSTVQLSAAVIMLTGGSKLAQAAAYERAYVWLDTLLQVQTPRGAVSAAARDTASPRHQVRVNASFWYGLSSVLTLAKPYKEMTEAKGATRCDQARAVFARLARTKAALQLGRRVHPPTADQMLGFVAQYEQAKPQVQRAFRCRPALN